MEYPTRAPSTPQPVVKVQPKRQTNEEWAVDVCKVGPTPGETGPYRGECIDGFVWREIDGYSTAFACPVCERWRSRIPTAKRWMGKVSLYTPQQMLQMVNRRQDQVASWRTKAAKMPDIQIEMVADGPF